MTNACALKIRLIIQIYEVAGVNGGLVGKRLCSFQNYSDLSILNLDKKRKSCAVGIELGHWIE